MKKKPNLQKFNKNKPTFNNTYTRDLQAHQDLRHQLNWSK